MAGYQQNRQRCPCHLRHEVVRPSQASRVTHSARADVRTRESSIATPPAGNTTETNTAGYQSALHARHDTDGADLVEPSRRARSGASRFNRLGPPLWRPIAGADPAHGSHRGSRCPSPKRLSSSKLVAAHGSVLICGQRDRR